MSAMSDFAIFEETLDFVAVDSIGCICSDCLDVVSAGDWHHAPNDHIVCDDCSEQYAECHHCNEMHERDDMMSHGSEWLCNDCYDDHFFTCEHCDSITPNSQCTDVDGDLWCRDCRRNDATRCCACHTWTRDDNTIGYHDGPLCESCYEDSYFTCDVCGEVYHNDDYDANGCCNNCHASDPDSIMDYSTDILNVFGVRIDQTEILYGVELEVVSTYGDRESDATVCRELLGSQFAITKHDGSLPDGGFEIVTIPANLKRHTKRWSSFLDSPPRGLRSWENPKCGMHVHVSRAPLSALTIGKILVFINADENKRFVVGIAGRESTGYAEFKDKKLTDGKRTNRNRYEAINLQHYGTVEFRIFKGTLKKTSFLKNLEFVAATVRFCQLTGIGQLDVKSFLDWFKGVHKDYPNLDQWLIKHSYIPSRSKPNKKASVQPCV